jgi:hypothetical protein
MVFIHCYPLNDEPRHITRDGGAGCWCEPIPYIFTVDPEGEPERVFIHGCNNKKCKAIATAKYKI